MNTANPSARERLHAKIRALLAKTTEAGCTEAEALSAAALASDLMDRYNVEHGDLDGEPWHTEYTTREGAETRGTKRRKNARKAAFAFRALIYGEIGRYCHCHGIMNPDKGTIRFHGRHSDALFATWLLEALDAFAYRAWGGFEAIHALDDNFLVDSDKEAFMTALAHRLNERLKEAREAALPPAGNGIVLHGDARRRAALENALTLWPNLSTYRPTYGGMRRDPHSAAAGADAAGRASFNRPMGGGTSKPLLLK